MKLLFRSIVYQLQERTDTLVVLRWILKYIMKVTGLQESQETSKISTGGSTQRWLEV